MFRLSGLNYTKLKDSNSVVIAASSYYKLFVIIVSQVELDASYALCMVKVARHD